VVQVGQGSTNELTALANASSSCARSRLPALPHALLTRSFLALSLPFLLCSVEKRLHSNGPRVQGNGDAEGTKAKR
jgi:hypothetical protein